MRALSGKTNIFSRFLSGGQGGSAFSSGNALHLNGANGFVVNNVNSILSGSPTYCMEYWFKSDTATWSGSNRNLIGNYNSAATNGFGSAGLVGTKQLTADAFNGSIARGIYALSNITVKTHVRIVFNGGLSGNPNRMKMYINGSQITFDSFVGTIPATIGNSGDKLYFGSFRGIANYFDGWLDQFSLWSDAVGSDTYNGGLGADPTLTNLIAYCKFNESNPSATTLDETGNNIFTLTNFNYDANDGFAPLT